MKLTINVDGGSRGNPGPAAYGCYIRGAGSTPISLKGRLGNTTNNIAEYHGLIRALEKAVELGAEEVQILADSELMVRQMTGVYKVKNEHIAVLYKIASDLVRQIGKVHFKHVYREDNSVADALCNEALDDPRLPNETLGLKHPQSPPPKASAKKLAPIASTEVTKPKESAKVKLVGSLLSLMSMKSMSEYAVVVKGTSWRLSLARIPSGVKPGDLVVVLGELVVSKAQPLVKVKTIRKA